jgi:hydroxymethylpyrimidine/phosphomethylpyrimidine kinase
VFDPVMIAKSGCRLLDSSASDVLIQELLPLSFVVTPNIPEAEAITGFTIKDIQGMEAAARRIHALGPANVLLKGGHLEGDATDLLFDGQKITLFPAPRLPEKNTHGTGCTLSSAIASNLAKGLSVEESVSKAKEYITIAIKHGITLGKGIGPVHHFYSLYQKANL